MQSLKKLVPCCAIATYNFYHLCELMYTVLIPELNYLCLYLCQVPEVLSRRVRPRAGVCWAEGVAQGVSLLPHMLQEPGRCPSQ